MKLSELLKLFSQNNIRLIQHGKRHDIYYSPLTNKSSPYPATQRKFRMGRSKASNRMQGFKRPLTPRNL